MQRNTSSQDIGLNTTDASNLSVLVGWQPQNAGRGTLDIITSCLLTILICVWTTIHPRIHISNRLARWHKGMQLVKMIFAPEMVCLESLQEWIQARKLMRRTAQVTEGELSLVHAYYLGMLGVRYRSPTGWNVLWPGQYAWLLKQKLVRWRDRQAWGLDVKLIRDKNKADGLVKLATVWQVVWFTVQCITREVNQVPITPLEAMTLAYVCVALITYGFWWKKPKDITTASFIELPQMSAYERASFDALAMELTYDIDKNLRKPSLNIAWYLVARDCEESNTVILLDEESGPVPEADCAASHRTNIQSKSAITTTEIQEYTLSRAFPLPSSTTKPTTRPAETDVITEWDSTLYMSMWWPLICLLGSTFGALHLVSWNSHFPTQFEMWLWRGSALVSVATSLLCMQFRTMSLKWDGPLSIVRIGSPLLYIVSRVIMTAEVFAALRAMPAKAYAANVIWSYWFHFS